MSYKTYSQALGATFGRWKLFVMEVSNGLKNAEVVAKSVEEDSSVAIINHNGVKFQLRRAIREAAGTVTGECCYAGEFDLVISVKGRRARRVLLDGNGEGQSEQISEMIETWYTK